MSDIRIPDWQLKSCRFESRLLQTSLVEVLNTQTSETGGEHMLGNGEPGVPMSTAI